MKGNSDIKLLSDEFRNGNEKAFTEIYYACVKDLYSYGHKLTPDLEILNDSLQEIFIDFYDRVKKSKIEIKNPRAYLFIALKNSIIKGIQKNRKIISEENLPRLLDSFDVEYGIEESLINIEISNEISSKIRKAKDKLSPRQKEIIYLKFEEECSYKEISVLMKITVESARKQLYRAIFSLRDILDGHSFSLILSMILAGSIQTGLLFNMC